MQAAVCKPAEAPHVPAGQSIQGAPPSEYLPAAQSVHAAIAVLPEGDEVPAAQDAQTAGSVRVFDVAPARAYLPIGHVNDRHAPPLPVEYVPAVHVVHAAIAILAAGDDLPATQEAQTVGSVGVLNLAPARAYFPAGQDMGPVQVATERPGVDPYVPAGH